MACARAAGSPGGTSQPVRPVTRTSAAPPTQVATTGVPNAMASSMARETGTQSSRELITDLLRAVPGWLVRIVVAPCLAARSMFVLAAMIALSVMPTSTTAAPLAARGEFFISPSGSDSNDGRSPATAWRSFSRVRANRAPAGSVILAQAGGVWHETVQLQANNLTLSVYGSGPRPKIVAPDAQYAFDSDWRTGTHLEGWEFTSETRRGGRSGIVHVAGNDHVVRDIKVHGADGWMFVSRGVRGLVENSEFYDNDGSGETTAVSIGGYEGTGYPDWPDVSIIRNSYIHDTKYRALATWGTNVLIENNRVERWSAPGRTSSATQAPAGIYVSSRYQGYLVVRNNLLAGSGVEHRGIWVDTGPENRTFFDGNTVTDVIDCLRVEKTDNVVVRGNTCERIQSAGVRLGSGYPDNGDPAENAVIFENRFVGPTPADDWIKVYPGSTAQIYTNLFIR